MYNKIIVATYLLIISPAQAMDKSKSLQGPRDPNTALILATISGPLDQQDLENIDFLFQVGADPNHISPLYKITPLMRAVRVNEPDLVQLLLKKGAQVNVCDPNNIFVRNFNLIYDTQEIMYLVKIITDNMLKIETHNIMSPNESIDCAQALYTMMASDRLRKALFIDRILENNLARSHIKNGNHPLLIALKDTRVRRALRYALNDRLEDVPNNVWAMLAHQSHS